MNASLYEISRDFLVALDGVTIDEETGEVTGFDALDAVAAQFDDKAESIACYIKNVSILIDGLKAEEAALSERRKRAERKVDSLKKYLTACFDTVGRDKVETARAKISFRKSVAVQIDDEAALPADYKVETVTVKPDKTAIKKAIQGGAAVAGASLVENRNIQIK